MKLKQIIEQAKIVNDHVEVPFEHEYRAAKSKKILKLIKNKIPPLDLKFYEGVEVFYLTDKGDNYLGHIEYSHLNGLRCKAVKIDSTFSKYRGFYRLLFDLIFSYTSIQCIFGDSIQTKRAIKSWKKLLKEYDPIVYNLEEKEFLVFDSYKEFEKREDEFWGIETKKDKFLIGVSKNSLNESNGVFEFFEHKTKRLERLGEQLTVNRLHEMLIRGLNLDEFEIDELKPFIEQARIVDNHIGYSLEMDYKQEKSSLKLLKDRIPPFDLKVFQGNNVFYLTDKNDEYLGHIEYNELKVPCKTITFTSTYSKQRGFYKILFEVIFIKTEYQCIFGDEQTKRAISAWKNMLKKYYPVVLNTKTEEIKEFNTYEEFEKENEENHFWDLKNNTFLVGVTKKNLAEELNLFFDFLNERMEHHRRIPRSNHIPEMLVRSWDLTEDEANELIEFFGEKK